MPDRPPARLPLAVAAVLGVLLALAAVADSWRCVVGLGVEGWTTRIALLATAGAAAAFVCGVTALGAVRRQEWAAWVAALVGLASVPQAAATGFRPPYAAPDSATLIIGLLLLITVLTGVRTTAEHGNGDDCATRGAAFGFSPPPESLLLRWDATEREGDHRGDPGGDDGQYRQ